MLTPSTIPHTPQTMRSHQDLQLAATITREASTQTYYTVQFLVDRGLMQSAYKTYGYFRWLDDRLDQGDWDRAKRMAFVARQKEIIDRCYRNERPGQLLDTEMMVVELIDSDRDHDSGLYSYIRNMMAVMAFDARRRGQLISREELSAYTRWLATGVTEALHYFIGHGSYSPHTGARYLAVTAAHITHMLRDTLDDVGAGYYNIPCEVLELRGIRPDDVSSDAYRQWVQGRVQLARGYFSAGKDYLDQVKSARCRIAGYAYIARFETVLDTIERESYLLRSGYPEDVDLGAGARIALMLFRLAACPHNHGAIPYAAHRDREALL